MKAKVNKNIQIVNIICVLLMLCLVVGQFIPFWGVELPNAETGEPEMQTAALLGVTGRQYIHGELSEKLCEITSQRKNPVGDTFAAKILEVESGSLLVQPLDGKAQQAADEIVVALPEGNTESYKVGDRLHIDYTDIDYDYTDIDFTYIDDDFLAYLVEVHAVDSCTFHHTYINTQVLLTIVLGAFAVLLCVKNSHGWLRALLTLVAAGASAMLWLTVPAYTLGVLGHILFAISAILLVIGLWMVILFVREKMIEKKEREQE